MTGLTEAGYNVKAGGRDLPRDPGRLASGVVYAGWGWALWNLRGDFGVLDSRRADVRYEDYQGHKLDRAMLDLLRAF